jgi:dolichol-phosphate mannosyltransferase
MEATHLSVILPAFDERDTIGHSLEELFAALAHARGPWEVIVVDDGSGDGTSDLVAGIIECEPRLRLIRLSRNFGKEGALAAGLAAASGDYVAILDADLQDPPAVMLEMLAKAEAGHDVVYGVRRSRRATPLKRAAYAVYYRLLKSIAEPAVPLDSGDFCVLSRRVVDAVNRLPERNRFLRTLRAWVGFRQVGHPYDRAGRRSGTSKYTWPRLFDLAAVGFVSSSRAPLKLSIWLGLLLAGLGFVWAIKVLLWKILYDTAPQGFAASIVAILVVGGSQLVAIGVMGYYLGRVLDQVENRPGYVIDRTVNCPGRGAGPR